MHNFASNTCLYFYTLSAFYQLLGHETERRLVDLRLLNDIHVLWILNVLIVNVQPHSLCQMLVQKYHTDFLPLFSPNDYVVS